MQKQRRRSASRKPPRPGILTTRLILPSVSKELATIGKDHILTKFMVLDCAKKFPLTNIAFSLFCDVVLWYSLSETRCMRYSADIMQLLWGVV